jgi:hypothetical protein
MAGFCCFTRRGSGASPGPMPDPEHRENQRRSGNRGHDVPQRDRGRVEPWEEPQKAEQETADEGSDQTHAEVLQGAEAPALPRDDEPGEASADQAHDDPDDDLRKGRHHGSLLGMSSHSAGAGVTPVIWARGSSLSQRVTGRIQTVVATPWKRRL